MEASPRVVFIGDSGVGKTSLIHWAKYNKFNEAPATTIGAGITRIEADANGIPIAYQLWDTAGQEMYRSIVPMYFRGVCGIVVVFSLTQRSSFEHVEGWVSEAAAHTDQVPIVVVGNKCDCSDVSVSQAEARAWGEQRKIPVLFTSASTGENVELLLEHLQKHFVVPALSGGNAFTEQVQRREQVGMTCC